GASGVSYDCNQDLQSSFGVTWRIYEVVRKIYYLKLQDLFSASLTNPENLGGVLCTFDSQLISCDGLSFNATPKIAVQCGVDAGWDSDSVGSPGALYGAPYSPAVADSRWVLANADGTRRTHYVATFLHPDSYQDLTSAYAVGGGKCVSTVAEFQANFPKRIYQPTL
ncbi:MAG: hypothetical protein KBF68_05345, partial [Nitrosomonas sp.]|nr:hypothetical protein [Nitrosomonas sp.]